MDEAEEQENIRVQNPNQLRNFPQINIEEELKLRDNQPSSDDDDSMEYQPLSEAQEDQSDKSKRTQGQP